MTTPVDVWAPNARTVQLATPDRGRLDLVRGDDGWWRLDGEHRGAYRFVVDGDELPDPRSPWQPEGIRGPSHTVDHDAFVWRDHSWHGRPLASSVLYELHVGTFTPEGTFDAAIGRLDHLVDLGVHAVELMPVAEFPGARGWGYDGVFLFAPHHHYGGPDGLKRFVDACHQRDLAVVLDVVYNHLGPSGNHLARFGPYFTDRYRTPWGAAVNLDDSGSDEVRRFFCDNAIQWLRDYHLDGLRLDAVHALFDQSATPFLEQLANEVCALGRALGRPLWLIAESSLADPRLIRSRDAHGFGLDAQWNDDLHHAIHTTLTGDTSGYYADFGSLDDLARAYDDTFVYDGRYSRFRGRRHGRDVTDIPPERFVVFTQNHDQVGNRALGERLSALVPPARLYVAAALVLLSPFVPLLFQGEEWGATSPFLYFTDHDEPELAEAVRKGRREEFSSFEWGDIEVPDPQSADTFERSKLDWGERRSSPHTGLLDWYRQLLALRPMLLGDAAAGAITGPSRAHAERDLAGRWFRFTYGGWVIATNLGDTDVDVPLCAPSDNRGLVVVASAGEATLHEAAAALCLGPDAVAVLAPRAHPES